jgi:uncharacterized protein (DUF1501 family)
MRHLSRRQLLKGLGAGALLHATGSNHCEAFGQVSTFESTQSDYKMLVCVFLLGGNDSFNMVVPRTEAEYAEYARARQNLAVPKDVLLPLNLLQPDPDGQQFGMHPALAELAAIFERDAACAIIANVGSLIQPTTREQYFSRSVALPPQLFSHNDQQDQWNTLRGVTASHTGWAGRIADVLSGRSTTGQSIPMNISLAGETAFQAGELTDQYTMGAAGPVPLYGLNGSDSFSMARRTAFEELLKSSYSTAYEREFARSQERALTSTELLRDALGAVRPPNSAPFNVVFPGTPLGTQLRTVAETIAVRERLRAGRQIFFVATGGFDTHDRQLTTQPELFRDLSQSLAAFYRACVEMRVATNVTTFTESEFGRTLSSNGDGTDHAWGGVHLVIGGAVRGRGIYGRYPALKIGGEADVGGGRMIPGISTDQYATTLARWFGVPETELALISPNTANFPSADLGFML